MTNTAAQAAVRLQRQMDDELTNLVSSHHTFGELARNAEDDEAECDAPLLSEFLSVGGDETLRAMTNFSSSEFDSLWALVENEVMIIWTLGRGRKPAVAPKDSFFVTLAVLKHFDTWFKHALDFNMTVSTIEKTVHRVIEIVESRLYELPVKPVVMADQQAEGHLFKNHPYALYATDVKFQPAYRPTGRFIEQKVYFSAKHKLYGFKIECSVAPPGVAVAMSVHHPGSTSDLTIMLDRVTTHRQLLKKGGEHLLGLDREATEFPGMWAMLVDKGYQGAGRVLRTIQPKKKTKGSTLDHVDLSRNKAISSDRVLVENFFGRMRTLWNATYLTFKWNENRFDSVARLCVALTNYHVSLMPIRAQDSGHYDMVLAKYLSMGDRALTQRAEAQRRYRVRQLARSHPYMLASRRRSSDSETQYSNDYERSLAF